ncbi:hypothetical protein [Nonomuraea guangzhouensis]|uniref:Uncharacterized protein n=1 Tax=Nonomuraea guangzhouensis TaxID=1291555 RepID=A0ABW4GYY2_9ACTN|nr:hypothetical protein [Nonomuraea guangzhouensis]
MLFGTLGRERGVAEDSIRGAGVDAGGEVTTAERSATLWRGVGIEATLVRGEALSVGHPPDQMPKPTQARKPAMSAGLAE